MIENFEYFVFQNPTLNNILSISGTILLIIISNIIVYYLLARGIEYLAKRTQSNYNDIIVRGLPS